MTHMTLDLNGYFERIGYRGAILTIEGVSFVTAASYSLMWGLFVQIAALSNYEWTEVKPGTDLVKFPDGKQIIFFEFPESSSKPARMYQIPAEGGSPKVLLPDDPHHQQDPNWSPDGTKIIFAGDANDAANAASAPAILPAH